MRQRDNERETMRQETTRKRDNETGIQSDRKTMRQRDNERETMRQRDNEKKRQ